MNEARGLFLSTVLVMGVTSVVPAQATGIIQGTIRDQDGVRVSDAVVSAHKDGEPIWLSEGDDRTDSFGFYQIVGLQPGTYRLDVSYILFGSCPACILPQWHDRKRFHSEADPVNVTDATVTIQDIILKKGGRIFGRVRDDDGQNVNSAVVTVYNMRTEPVSQVFSSLDGIYITGGLWPCEYKVGAADWVSPLLIDSYYEEASSLSDAVRISVGDYPDVVTGVDIILPKGGALTGAIYGEDGSPLFSTSVESFRQEDGRSSSLGSTTGNFFEVGKLKAPGPYRIRARYYQRNPDALAYIPTWYGNTADFDNAQDLYVTRGSTLGGKNIILPIGGRIRGMLLDKDELPAFAGFVEVYGQDGLLKDQVVKTGPDNPEYVTPLGLSAGEHRLLGNWSSSFEIADPNSWTPTVTRSTFIRAWFNGKRTCAEADRVIINLAQTEFEKNFSVPPHGTMAGILRDEAGSLVNKGEVWVSLFSPPPGSAYISVLGSSVVDLDGSYRVEGLPAGDYSVCYRPVENETRLIPVCYDGKDGSIDPARIKAVSILPNQTTDRDLIIPLGRRILGSSGAGCDPLQMYVQVYDADTGYPLFSPASSFTLEDGTFATLPLPPGAYRLYAWVFDPSRGFNDGSEWYDGKSQFAFADRIVVSSSEDTLGINFTLEPGGSLSGRVLGPSGMGVPGTWIQIVDLDNKPLLYPTTREGGYWDIRDIGVLAAGQYKVSATPPECTGLGVQWYNKKREASLADPVRVNANEAISGIDFILQLIDTDGDGMPDVDDPDDDNDGFLDDTDCDPTDNNTYPNAPEINDGKDNQCLGDLGYGVVDEVSGQVGFNTSGDPSSLCWVAQTGATAYEVARSDNPTFSMSCTTVVVSETCWSDPDNLPGGGTFYYLVRTVIPFAGSWGQDSSGAERTNICP